MDRKTLKGKFGSQIRVIKISFPKSFWYFKRGYKGLLNTAITQKIRKYRNFIVSLIVGGFVNARTKKEVKTSGGKVETMTRL